MSTERKVTRRKYLGLSLGLMSASLLAACAPAAAPAPTAAPAKAAEPAKPAAAAPTEAPKPAQAAPTSAKPATAADASFDGKQFNGEAGSMLFLKHP